MLTQGQSEREPAELLYHHLMDLHDRAFGEARFEAAYHVLAAALHVAEELGSVEWLSNIRRLATDRQEEIDRTFPDHGISSASSLSRGNVARFTTLALTAKAMSGRIAADRALERSQGRRDSPPRPGLQR
jgi:hypothetical protein